MTFPLSIASSHLKRRLLPSATSSHNPLVYSQQDFVWGYWKPINQWQTLRPLTAPTEEKVQGHNPTWCRHKYANHVIHNAWLKAGMNGGWRREQSVLWAEQLFPSHKALNAQQIVSAMSAIANRLTAMPLWYIFIYFIQLIYLCVYQTWAIRKFARSTAKQNYGWTLKGAEEGAGRTEKLFPLPTNWTESRRRVSENCVEDEATKKENIFCGSQIK